MAIQRPTLWLPPGVREHADAAEALRLHASQAAFDEPSSIPKTLEDAYIEKLRANGYHLEALEETPNIPWDELQRTMKQEFVTSSLREGYSLSTAMGLATAFGQVQQQPSAHQAFAAMLREEANVVEHAIKERCGTLRCPVYVNEYPSHAINAFVEPHGMGYIIVVHRGIMIALYLAAKICSWNWGFTHFDDAGIRRSECPWTGERTVLALAVLAGEIIQRNITYAPRHRIPSGIRLWMCTSMLRSAEQFILAHEYAHILNDDCLGENEQDEASKENAADSLAWHLLFANVDRSGRTPGGRDNARAVIAGIVMLFGLRHLVLQVGKAAFGKESVYVVPEPERSQRFRQFLERDDDKELLACFDSHFDWWSLATRGVLEFLTWSKANPTPYTGDRLL